MQGIYAWTLSGQEPGETFEINLKETLEEVRKDEKTHGDKGDSRFMVSLYYETIKNQAEFDQHIQSKASNWDLDRIALIDRILMEMAICEFIHFEDIPVKVTINEFLEIAKLYSTPKSSGFINGILDNLSEDLKNKGLINKKGRGLLEKSISNKKPPFKKFNQDNKSQNKS